MAINVVIVEDEQPAARRLKRMAEALQLNVITLLHSVDEAINWFNTNTHPDLIFLDIQLSDGLSFEIFEAIDIKSSIIITTAFDEYALKAFKLNSVDYLLKPIDEDELAFAVKKFQQKENKQLQGLQLDIELIRKILINPLDRKFKTRFTIKIGQRLKIIPIEEVVCFFSENKGTYLHTNQNRSFLIEGTLEQLELLIDASKYFRVNRTFLVKLDAITDIIAYTNNRLKLDIQHFDKEPIIVSREKVKDFKDWLEK